MGAERRLEFWRPVLKPRKSARDVRPVEHGHTSPQGLLNHGFKVKRHHSPRALLFIQQSATSRTNAQHSASRPTIWRAQLEPRNPRPRTPRHEHGSRTPRVLFARALAFSKLEQCSRRILRMRSDAESDSRAKREPVVSAPNFARVCFALQCAFEIVSCVSGSDSPWKEFAFEEFVARQRVARRSSCLLSTNPTKFPLSVSCRFESYH